MLEEREGEGEREAGKEKEGETEEGREKEREKFVTKPALDRGGWKGSKSEALFHISVSSTNNWGSHLLDWRAGKDFPVNITG